MQAGRRQGDLDRQAACRAEHLSRVAACCTVEPSNTPCSLSRPHRHCFTKLHRAPGINQSGKHGIIASKRCDHVVVMDNKVDTSGGSGIMLHRSCDDSIISGECLGAGKLSNSTAASEETPPSRGCPTAVSEICKNTI